MTIFACWRLSLVFAIPGLWLGALAVSGASLSSLSPSLSFPARPPTSGRCPGRLRKEFHKAVDPRAVLIGASGPLKVLTVTQYLRSKNEGGETSQLQGKMPLLPEPESPREKGAFTVERLAWDQDNVFCSSPPMTSGGWRRGGYQRTLDSTKGFFLNGFMSRSLTIVPIHTKEISSAKLQNGMLALPEGFRGTLEGIAREGQRQETGKPLEVVIFVQGPGSRHIAPEVQRSAESELFGGFPTLTHRLKLHVFPVPSTSFVQSSKCSDALEKSWIQNLWEDRRRDDFSKRENSNGLALPAVKDSVSTQRVLSDIIKGCWSARRGLGSRGACREVDEFRPAADDRIRRHFDMFCRRTLRQSGRKERHDLKNGLAALLLDDARETFYKQLMWLERRTRLRLRDKLAALLRRGVINDDQFARAIRQAQIRFVGECWSMTPKLIGDERVGLDQLVSDCCAGLESFAAKFVNSPLAQMALHLGSSGQRSRSVFYGIARAAQRLRVAVGLTGMVRQRGNGNLQGYANYDIGPISLTLGYANDRNLPDASQSGKKPPSFRLQPRFHFELR